MSKSKKKYYAVAEGKIPGIYKEWFGEGGAQIQIQGIAGAKYKGFTTLEEAQKWLNNPDRQNQKPASSGNSREKNKKNGGSPPSANRKPAHDEEIKNHLANGKVIVYTDGGCHKNPGPGGYGAVLLSGEKRKELSGGYRLTTNNRMELMACIVGLKALNFPCSVQLYSDSQYVVNGIKKGWAKRWKQKGWMRNAVDAAENADLWEELLELTDQHDVEFNWVKGHAGNPGNERCDELANQATADEENFSRDIPFETGKTKKA